MSKKKMLKKVTNQKILIFFFTFKYINQTKKNKLRVQKNETTHQKQKKNLNVNNINSHY